MLLKIESLTKTFGAATAVDRADILVDKPAMIGVIGRSGAGKSTLLRMINRLTDASSGRILVEGRDVLTLKGAALRAWRRDCAMIFQQFNLVPRLDVVTNVMLGRLNGHSALASAFNVFGEADIRAALGHLERLGIEGHALKRAEALSGGQQQRVAIARALMQNPKFVLADEPIASLDPMNAQVVMDALRRIHEEDGLTVICNLHTLDTARRYCDRVIGMRAGRIVFDGPSELLTEAMAREIYGAGAEFSEASTSTSIGALAPDAALARAASGVSAVG
ncbi:phosphonate transport system ATP-binding protein [Albimonas donghaensis]|uniref:Phosphonate transport system ATP-binding protein n=1 Tax=Albimonas donghaensis TaxID=356660 RepID=A0A1H2WZC3_9RHOB|nr:phosphonate transport system ATP-binding protein [Albimonas donghaensis]